MKKQDLFIVIRTYSNDMYPLILGVTPNPVEAVAIMLDDFNDEVEMYGLNPNDEQEAEFNVDYARVTICEGNHIGWHICKEKVCS